jgi:hypothetical protein
MRSKTLIFYMPNTGGKWHTVDSITKVATCYPQIIDTTTPSIHVSPHQVDIHPTLCKRCLTAK